jgi:hypothetical protein
VYSACDSLPAARGGGTWGVLMVQGLPRLESDASASKPCFTTW